MANLLSADPVANLLKNAPKRSEFAGVGTVFALSLSLSLSHNTHPQFFFSFFSRNSYFFSRYIGTPGFGFYCRMTGVF
jgi:hypothetical protein